MEFPGVLKKRLWKLQGSVKKRWNFQGRIIKKLMWNFRHGFWFLIFEFESRCYETILSFRGKLHFAWDFNKQSDKSKDSRAFFLGVCRRRAMNRKLIMNALKNSLKNSSQFYIIFKVQEVLLTNIYYKIPVFVDDAPYFSCFSI